MRTRLAPVLACVATGALGLALCAGPAVAEPNGANTAYSAAAKVVPGTGLAPTVVTGGVVGALLGAVTPVLNSVVTPLATSLTNLSGDMVTAVGGLTGADQAAYASDSPTSPQGTYPSCGTAPWNDNNCYGPSLPTVNAAAISLGSGSLQGFAASDSTGSQAKARSANLLLTVLGVPLGNLGVADSTATCSAALQCAGAASLVGTSLLGGAVAVRTASDGSLQVSLAGGAFVSASSLSAPVTVAAAGVASLTVQFESSLLKLHIGLTLHSLLGALGIPDTLAALGAQDSGSTVVLTLGLGTTAATTSTTGTSHGLDVTLGLAVNAVISVLGLATVGLVAADSPSGGNLMTLQLAYASTADIDTTRQIRLPVPI